MPDSDDGAKPTAIPAWQRNDASQPVAETEQSSSDRGSDDHSEQRLEVARKFLEQDEVKDASRDKKVQFLKSKGIADSDIEALLGQSETARETTSSPSSPQGSEIPETNKSTDTKDTAQQPAALLAATNDRPPIVTYPEFLVKPERPPPLVTKNRLLNALYGVIGLSTVLYGTSKYLVGPMVDSLTDARVELHDTASKKLDNLVAQLEKTVSEVPPAKSQPPLSADDAESSDAEDPTEMFHRDVGTQTSALVVDGSNRTSGTGKEAQLASIRQAESLTSLTKSLSVLKDQMRAQSEGFEDVKTLIDVFRDDLDGMTYGGHAEFVGGYDIYGSSRKNEPEDEIRKVRDNIRRVKGVLLSTRSFPASTR